MSDPGYTKRSIPNFVDSDSGGRQPCLWTFRKRWGLTIVFLLLVAVSLSSRMVGANPGPALPNYYTENEAIAFLFIFNFPIDMFWFASMVYLVCVRWGPEAGRLSKSTGRFVATVVLSSILIAIIGAIADFLAFYRSNGWTKYYF